MTFFSSRLKSDSPEHSSAFSQLSHAVMSLVHARLELIGIELAEEKDRLVSTVLLGVVAAMVGMLALIGFTALIVIVLWDSYRWQPLAILSVIYLLVCGACLLRVRQATIHAPPAFALTRAEFDQDRTLFERRAAEHED